MNDIIISNDLGCVYRLNDNDQLEYAPLVSMGKNYLINNDDFTSVEPDLVGDEIVTFEGQEVPLYEVFKQVTQALKGETV